MKIGYLVHSFFPCGGVRIIFEHCNRLAGLGHEVYIIRTDDHRFDHDWFRFTHQINFLEVNDYPKLDIVVATYWKTHKYLEFFPPETKKMYFVQADETRFERDEAEEVKDTLRDKGVIIFTEARWIQAWLGAEFYRDSVYIPNGLNFSDFYPEPAYPRKKDRKIRILVEGNLSSADKGIRNIADSVSWFREECEVWLATNSEDIHRWAKDSFDEIFSQVDTAKMRRLYSSCDIFIKPSRIEGSPLPPMEAMACRCALIITHCKGDEEYCHDGFNCLKYDFNDQVTLKNHIRKLIMDDAFRNAMIDNASEYAEKNFKWENKIEELEVMFREVKKGKKW